MKKWIIIAASFVLIFAIIVGWEEAKRCETSTTANSFRCRVLTPANLPTIFLVLIGIGGIVVAIGTLNLLEEQTEATLIAAKAAEKSAVAFLDSERAWLIPVVEHIKPAILSIRALTNSHIERVTVQIKNYGRTPAWVMDWSIRAEVLDDTNIGLYTNASRPEGDLPNASAFDNLIWPTFDTFIWPTLGPLVSPSFREVPFRIPGGSGVLRSGFQDRV